MVSRTLARKMEVEDRAYPSVIIYMITNGYDIYVKGNNELSCLHTYLFRK